MSEKEQPKTDRPKPDNIPQKREGDYFEKGQQGITPPKPISPQGPGPGEGGMNEGAPGWTPPKSDD
ncbi:MAG: hypothetical protein JWP69_1340 [Flaviaesturariibacter sp.]|nr:hypothetical protein [Flaviaesturariibacter sp.]